MATGPTATATATARRARFDGAVAQFLREYFEAEPVGGQLLRPDGVGRAAARPDRRRVRGPGGGGGALAGAVRGVAETASDGSDGSRRDGSTPSSASTWPCSGPTLGQAVATADFAAWRRYPTVYLENGVFELFVHGTRDEAVAVEAAVQRMAPGARRAGGRAREPRPGSGRRRAGAAVGHSQRGGAGVVHAGGVGRFRRPIRSAAPRWSRRARPPPRRMTSTSTTSRSWRSGPREASCSARSATTPCCASGRGSSSGPGRCARWGGSRWSR